MNAAPPQTFVELKNLVRIHLKQILRIDKITDKHPINAVALLVVIAYEALSKSRHPRKGPEFLFAQEHLARHCVPLPIGARIFDALRNGLAHRYEPYPIPIEDIGDVRLELAWKDCAAYHLGGIAIKLMGSRQKARPFPRGSTEIPRALCLNVESMWLDLDDLFSRYEAELRGDGALRTRFELSMARNTKRHTRETRRDTACEWRDFLIARRIEETE